MTAETDVFGDGTTLVGAGTAVVAGATVKFEGTVVASHLELDYGTFQVDGTLQVANLNWIAGKITGPGLTTVNGSLSIAGPASLENTTMNLSGDTTVKDGGTLELQYGAWIDNTGHFTLIGNGSVSLDESKLFNDGTLVQAGHGAISLFGSASTLLNRGTVSWTGAGKLAIDDATTTNQGNWTWSGTAFDIEGPSGTIDNKAGANFTLATDGEAAWSGTFQNEGALIKSAGAGSVRFKGPFINNGLVTIQSGTLALQAGSSAGSFSVGSGATLEFSPDPTGSLSSYTLGTGTTTTGRGVVAIKGLTVSVDGDVSATNLELDSGELTGTADIIVHGALTWKGGSMSGTGLTEVAPEGRLDLAGGSSYTNLRTIYNRGTNVSTQPNGVFVSTDATFPQLANKLGPASQAWRHSRPVGSARMPFHFWGHRQARLISTGSSAVSRRALSRRSMAFTWRQSKRPFSTRSGPTERTCFIPTTVS